mmetsp:Transcript_63033/g.124617  ORF Transcript_63033/g.124617 Transcript_63033/m.124617 type:complete len:384 (+) Transcript_63033:77-1228(+)
MAAVPLRNLFMHSLLAVMVAADGRGHVSGRLHSHELTGEELRRHFQGLERPVGNGDFENSDGGGGSPAAQQPAVDHVGSGLQDNTIPRNARGAQDLSPQLPLGSLADASEQPAFDRAAAAQEQKLEKMAELMGAAQVTAVGSVRSRHGGSSDGRQRQATAAAAAAASRGGFVELQSAVESRDGSNGSLMELQNHKSMMELDGHKPNKVAQNRPKRAASFATAKQEDPGSEENVQTDEKEEKERWHRQDSVCYNELTVLGDLNEDGRFSPEEWHQMFKSLNSKSKDTNWRISPEDFRKGLPNCDFVAFAMGDKKEDKKKKAWNHLDYYEWQGVMENADKDRDFLLNHDELVQGNFEPHAKGSEEAKSEEEVSATTKKSEEEAKS